MKISEEQFRKNLAHLKATETIAGPNDPIYSSGLRVNSIPAPRKSSAPQEITEAELQKRREHWDKISTIAGPDDPIYTSGLRVNSIPALRQKPGATPKIPPKPGKARRD